MNALQIEGVKQPTAVFMHALECKVLMVDKKALKISTQLTEGESVA